MSVRDRRLSPRHGLALAVVAPAVQELIEPLTLTHDPGPEQLGVQTRASGSCDGLDRA